MLLCSSSTPQLLFAVSQHVSLFTQVHQCRSEEGAEVLGEGRTSWHGRQSKDTRLADAAESRLMGLAARSRTGNSIGQQDMEPRNQQPTSYCRRSMQVLLVHALALFDSSKSR